MAAENALIASLRDRVGRVEAARKAARRSGWILVALGVILFLLLLPWIGAVVLGSLWTLGNVLVEDPGTVLVFVVTVGSAVIAVWLYFLFGRAVLRWPGDAQPAYERAYREQVLLPSLREALPGLAVTLDGPLDAETFEASALFLPKPDDFHARYGFTGRAGSTPLRGSVLDVGRWGYSHERRMRVRIPYFRGVLVHLERPVPLPSTLRLAHADVYEGWSGQEWDVKRRGNTVRAQSGHPQFDGHAMVVLDQEHGGMPPVPPALAQAWLDLDVLIGHPVFLALNQTGIYLAVATRMGRLPLDSRVQLANRPEELAEDLALLQRIVQGVDTLRKALALD